MLASLPLSIFRILFFFFFFFFFETEFLCEALAVLELSGQAGFELRNQGTSASQVLGLKACATTAWLESIFMKDVMCTVQRSSM